MNFKEPYIIEKPEQSSNFVVAVGKLQKFKDKNKTYEFYEMVETKSGRTFPKFQALLNFNNEFFRLQGLPTQKNPTKPKELADSANEGDYVKVKGFLTQTFSEASHRTYWDCMVNQIDITESENDRARVGVVLQGKVSRLEQISDNNFELDIAIPNIDQTRDDRIFTVTCKSDNPYTQWIAKKGIAPGDVLKVTAYYRNENTTDDFGRSVDSTNMIQLNDIEGYAKMVEKQTVKKENKLPF